MAAVRTKIEEQRTPSVDPALVARKDDEIRFLKGKLEEKDREIDVLQDTVAREVHGSEATAFLYF